MSLTRAWPWAVIWLAAASLACGYAFGPSGMLVGDWGGPHLQLTADSAGARLVYDCATGTIDRPIVLVNGHLQATGTHSPGHGGPDRIDEVPLKLPASYEGEVAGDRLTLTVSLTETGQPIGTFALKRGRPGLVVSCL